MPGRALLIECPLSDQVRIELTSNEFERRDPDVLRMAASWTIEGRAGSPARLKPGLAIWLPCDLGFVVSQMTHHVRRLGDVV